jgi:hypothetical protein
VLGKVAWVSGTSSKNALSLSSDKPFYFNFIQASERLKIDEFSDYFSNYGNYLRSAPKPRLWRRWLAQRSIMWHFSLALNRELTWLTRGRRLVRQRFVQRFPRPLLGGERLRLAWQSHLQ